MRNVAKVVKLTILDLYSSRFVALQALQAAARSDILYQTAGDFELQAEYLASALVANCYHTPVHDLRTLYVCKFSYFFFRDRSN